jgi:hypothetical protein
VNENLVKASVVKFNLPFMINLPDDDYLVNLEDTKATITIKRERKNVNPTIQLMQCFQMRATPLEIDGVGLVIRKL